MDKQQWQDECQTFELDFHQKENYRWDRAGFEAAWAKHFEEWCNVNPLYHIPSEYHDRVVLDVGCGSAPAIDYFEHSVKYYIDPLISEYIQIPDVSEYWTPQHENHSFTVPAEESLPVLYNACSFINWSNAIDHGYDWRVALDNVTSYAREGCVMYFSTDYAPHTGHTGIDDPAELFKMLEKEFDILKDEPGYWGRDMALLLRKK